MKRLFLFLNILASICTCGAFAENNDKEEAVVDALRVVVIGSGGKEGEERSLYEEALKKMFVRIKEINPDAVFYTGSLIFGLESKASPENLNIFRQRLHSFSQLTERYLGDEIPVYPVMGNHHLVSPEAVQLFREHFHIHNRAPLEPYQLDYPVFLDQVQFIVLATGIHERQYRGYRRYVQTMPLLDWLEKELRTGSEWIRYRIVVGHEPAFSPFHPAADRKGMGRDPLRRDLFWTILQENHVLAYFCSNGVMFDRSNRHGVWQIITGGAGIPESIQKEDFFFQHYILLTIPKNQEESPLVQVYDLTGKKWDEFSLAPSDRPVHQLRISGAVWKK
ncbi:MAG: hypothetical protein WB791_03165 [Waddliaceae bacterium]